MADPITVLDPISVGLEGLRLNGKVLDVDVAGAITNATLEHGLDQAGTLTLDLYDPHRVLLETPFCTERASARFGEGGRAGVYVLVKVSKNGYILTLVFEEQVVNALRQVTGSLKMQRSRINRTGFVRRLALDPRAARFVYDGVIAFWSLEQGPPSRAGITSRNGKPLPPGQPVVRRNDATSSKRKPDPATASGEDFDPAAQLTITDAGGTITRPDRNQKENVAIVLATALGLGASHKVLVAAIETIIVESMVRNLTGGDRDSVGLFQQRPSSGWRGLRNREEATREFVTRAIKVAADFPHYSPGEIAAAVQRPAAEYRYRYGTHEKEATLWVASYRGSAAAAPSTKGTSGGKGGSAEGYEFAREKDESSWDAIKRLAEDVQFRAFVSDQTVIFADDDALLLAPPILRLSEDFDWVESIDFDWDVQKPAGTATVILDVSGGPRGALPFQHGLDPGQVAMIIDSGPANGPWLISDVRYSFLAATVEVGLVRRRPTLAEPEDSTTKTTKKPEKGLPGDESPGAKAVAWAALFLGKPYHYGGGHVNPPLQNLVDYGNAQLRHYDTGFDCSSFVRSAWAQQGVYVGNSTFDMIDVYGPRFPHGTGVPAGGWKAGDLYFPERGHVMMMTGHGSTAIEAPHTGDVIKLAQVGPAMYWFRPRGAA